MDKNKYLSLQSLAGFLLIVVALFIGAGTLEAEDEIDVAQSSSTADSAQSREQSGFGAGRFLFEIRGSYGLDFGGSIARSFRDQNQIPAFGILPAFSGDANALALSIWSRSQAPEPELKSKGGSLSFEYGLFDWLGAGLSVNHNSYDVKNANPFPGSLAFGLLPIPGSLQNPQLINAEALAPLVPIDRDDFDRITSADLNVALHPLGGGGRFDPYLKLIGGYGQTKAFDLDVLRYGGALGLRFFLTDSIFVVTEVGLVNHEIRGDAVFGEFRGNLRQTDAQLGFGFAF